MKVWQSWRRRDRAKLDVELSDPGDESWSRTSVQCRRGETGYKLTNGNLKYYFFN
jgi:hypothetical protein